MSNVNGFGQLRNSLYAIGCAVLSMLSSFSVYASDSVVALLYHHVSETTPASTTVSPATFREHLTYLKENHQVVDLVDAIEALKKGTPLPDNAVIITFDDGYKNILENGDPILQEFGFPYTIFISPEFIGEQNNQLTWEDVKAMSKRGVRFANHTMDHLHMLDRSPDESRQAWLGRLHENVMKAEKIIESHVGYSLKYLAYPYGEFDADVQAMIDGMGYIGFGQHSGAVSANSDFTALPRYPAAGIYASLNSLKVKMASVAMPVKSSNIATPVVESGVLSEPIQFTFFDDVTRLNQLTCFYNGDTLPLQIEGQSVSIAFNETLPVGRSRINCTAPSTKGAGRYHWYSQPFFRPREDGTYPE